ncbi:MAG TPA: hypothetical protein VGS58_06975 [Candidatus Sulfopaludibacter sp.]|nr:hypothetical protein [Candidatus Sulfopaludibacter sp.]
MRIPSGWFFALLGAILLAYGILFPDARAALTEANVDLYCGGAMLAFGALLLLLAFRGRHSS